MEDRWASEGKGREVDLYCSSQVRLVPCGSLWQPSLLVQTRGGPETVDTPAHTHGDHSLPLKVQGVSRWEVNTKGHELRTRLLSLSFLKLMVQTAERMKSPKKRGKKFS